MSQQWAQVQEIPVEFLSKLRSRYAEIFPIQIRDCFSVWIDEKPWNQIDENDDSHRNSYALPLLQGLLQLIQNKAKVIPEFKECLISIENKYINEPLNFVRDMKICLKYEEQLLTASKSSIITTQSHDECIEGNILQMLEEFNNLNGWDAAIDGGLKEFKKKQEEFVILLRELPIVTAHFKKAEQDINERVAEVENLKPDVLNQDDMDAIVKLHEEGEKTRSRKEFIIQHLQKSIRSIWDLVNIIVQTLQLSVEELTQIQQTFLDTDLLKWKHKQQIACNGVSLDSSILQYLQKKCEKIQTLIVKNIQNIQKLEEILQLLPLENPENSPTTTSVQQRLAHLLVDLACGTFIVEQQPPQVLRKDNKFEASVSLLAGKTLNVQSRLPTVHAYILTEAQARTVHTNKFDMSTIRDLLNNKSTVEILPSGKVQAKFKNLVLKDFKRESRKGGQRIAEEKYCILFETKIKIGEFDLQTPLLALSVPVIITSHVNQECQALATISWDHQFSSQPRTLFEVPSSVAWYDLAILLNAKFKHETGRGLTDDHLNYLASKLFGESSNYASCHVTFNMFCKDNLRNHEFTFWDLFYSTMRVTKDHLYVAWNEGNIAGFISKAKAEMCMKDSSPGNFICRFSASLLGGVSISYSRDNGVHHTSPFTCKDLQIRSLPLLIMDTPKWTHLYPNKPKEHIFGTNSDDSPKTDGKSEYEKFIWTIKMSSSEDEREDITDQECDAALMEFIAGTDFDKLLKEDFEMR
ncbi:signal transducer and activator of transcription 5B-like [Mytilus trossulus]|uniref:signal transducer and activator of transcription 5B-like n=1 Tax=Mytilus trossulus TaxID=6551 RepID=UPI00300644F8